MYANRQPLLTSTIQSEVFMSIQTERQRASQVIDELYQNSFFVKYWETIGRFIRRGKPASIWLSAAVVMGANLWIGVTVSVLLGEIQFTTLNAIIQNAMWVTYSYLMLPLMINLHGRMIEFLHAQFAKSLKHEQHIHELTLWANQWLGQRIPQFLVALVFGLVVALAAFYGIYPSTKFSFGQTLIFFGNFFHMGVVFYGVFSLLAFVLKLKNWYLILYPDNPASSPILLLLSNELRNYILFIAVAGAILLLLVGSIGALNTTVIALMLIISWIPILTLFVIGNQAFSQQIIRVKYERLEELQTKIMELSNVEKMDTDTMAHVKGLMDYHDRVNSSQNSLYNAGSFVNLIGSLALPVLSVILSTIDVWQKIFGKP